MEHVFLALLLILLLFALLGSGLWIAFALTGVGYVVINLYSGAPSGQVLASTFGVPTTRGNWRRCRCSSGWAMNDLGSNKIGLSPVALLDTIAPTFRSKCFAGEQQMYKLVPAIVSIVLAVSAGSATAETWDMATAYPDFEFHTRNIRQFAEDVKKRTQGKLEIKVHSAQSLIKHPEIKNAVRSRQIPIGEFLLARLSNENPVYELDALPFLAASYEQAQKLWEAQKTTVETLLAGQNLKVLFTVPWPPQGLYTKKPITTTDDMKGLRFRTYNSVTERMARQLGMVPTQTEATEMATAFITGRVDAMMTSPSGGAQNKAWDWSTHFYNVQGWMPKNVVVVNAQVFQQLDKDTQTALLEAGEAAQKRGWEMSKADTQEGIDLLVKGGMQGIQPSPELIAGLKAVGATMTDEWVSKAGAQAKAVIDAYRSAQPK